MVFILKKFLKYKLTFLLSCLFFNCYSQSNSIYFSNNISVNTSENTKSSFGSSEYREHVNEFSLGWINQKNLLLEFSVLNTGNSISTEVLEFESKVTDKYNSITDFGFGIGYNKTYFENKSFDFGVIPTLKISYQPNKKTLYRTYYSKGEITSINTNERPDLFSTSIGSRFMFKFNLNKHLGMGTFVDLFLSFNRSFGKYKITNTIFNEDGTTEEIKEYSTQNHTFEKRPINYTLTVFYTL